MNSSNFFMHSAWLLMYLQTETYSEENSEDEIIMGYAQVQFAGNIMVLVEDELRKAEKHDEVFV